MVNSVHIKEIVCCTVINIWGGKLVSQNFVHYVQNGVSQYLQKAFIHIILQKCEPTHDTVFMLGLLCKLTTLFLSLSQSIGNFFEVFL